MSNQAVTLSIPGWVPPSLNEWQRMHWAKRGRVKNTAALLVMQALTEGHKSLPRFRGKVSIEITLSYPRNLRDEDNLVASVKPLLDAIRGLGVIVDDSPKWLELSVKQAKGRRQTACVIQAL